MTSTMNKDIVLVVSLVLSVVSLVLLFGMAWYCQSLQQQVEYDRELLIKLQEQINVSIAIVAYIMNLILVYVHEFRFNLLYA